MEQTLVSGTKGSTIRGAGQCNTADAASCRQPQRGFALIAALIAAIIMLALGIMVIKLSTQDLRSGAAIVGEKKAMTAADTGINQLMINFDPQDPGGLNKFAAEDVVVDATGAPGDQYSISVPSVPTSGPVFFPLPGYSIGGGQSWGQKRFDVGVTGKNINYGTQVGVDVGIGYGPIEISTMSR